MAVDEADAVHDKARVDAETVRDKAWAEAVYYRTIDEALAAYD